MPLEQGLADQAELRLLEVTQTAVQHFARGAACCMHRSERLKQTDLIASFQEGPCRHHTVDAGADDCYT